MTADRTRPTNHRRWPAAVAITMAALLLALLAPASPADAYKPHDSAVVVANRGSGDISVINTATLEVMNVDLPGEAEPMYVNHDTRNGRVLVGDRASSEIVAFDDETYDVVGTVPVGDGVFHQWLDVRRSQLWVVGTSSTSVTVVDSNTLQPIATIPMPADLVEDGGIPHDVFVSGAHAFVSMLDLEDGSGVVLQYSTRSFEETGRISTGDDPHLFVKRGQLYVASQGDETVSRYSARTLRLRGSEPIPAAHGIYVTNRGEVLVTNIAGLGEDAVWALDGRLRTVLDVADTDAPVPHNLTVDNRRQVFVTHSGSDANQVSVIGTSHRGFGDSQLVTVGTNPFGLAFVR